MADVLLTPKQTAARLGISVKTLLKLVRPRKIRYFRVGGGDKRHRRRFSEADIQAFVDHESWDGTSTIMRTKKQPPIEPEEIHDELTAAVYRSIEQALTILAGWKDD